MDFSDHDIDEILSDDWSRAHISDKAIVYKDIVYMTTSEHEEFKNTKLFNWYHCEPVQGDKGDIKQKENPAMIYVEDAEEISSMLAIGDEYFEE